MSNVRRQRNAWCRFPDARASFRSVQSGPVGQYEYTNAAGGVGWPHLRSYTKALRGNLGEIELPSPPGWWYLAFAFRPRCPLSSKAAGFCFKICSSSQHWLAAIAACPSSFVAPEWLRMPRKVMLPLPPHTLPSNPSIEGMPKRLRLLCTPHVKR